MTDIAVTGATGEVGGRVARRLAAAGVPQRLVVRDPGRAPSLPGAEVAVAEYGDRRALAEALRGIGTLMLVSATESPDRSRLQTETVQAAVDAGVERVVYTSFLGAAANATFTFAQDHWDTEEYIRASDVRFTILRDSLYQDLLPEYAGEDGVIRGPAGTGAFAPVTRDDVADTAVAVLLGGDHDGLTYDVTGPELITMEDVATRLSRALGRTIRYQDESVEEAYASRDRLGAPDWQVRGWVTSYEAIAAGELALVTDVVERVTGHPATGFTDFARAWAASR
ncbi:SDR family oxidoreductase [Bailinhaonella thermotolerans]|uniref:SDR family oxidoreductase n=1 Tax=Bailinhaonella thermotolerans TaxID=1070861 RepID=A0A3A4A204_9ACTN|nr:SDR family oxidoreductase [Bailinhaonella thermotolerans]RJL20546.1 SDR family oxidoreductase [Bailinhaonella thermotolerans]